MQEKSSINKLENIIGQVVAIILTIGLLVGGFLFAMDIASAESMSNGVIAFYDNNIGNCDNIEWFFNRIGKTEESFKNEFGYVYVSEIQDYLVVYFSKYKTSMPCLDCSTANLTIDYSTSSDSWVWGRSLSITNNIPSGTTVGYELFIEKSTSIIRRYLYMNWNSSSRYQYSVNLYNSTGSSTYSYWVDWDNNEYNYISYNGSSIPNYLNSVNLSNVKANFDYACIKPVVSNNMYALKVENITDFSEYLPPSTNTSGFNVFIYNDLGIDYVRFVPNGLVTVGSHYSNNPTISFDMVLNNDITIPVIYDESNGYYFESIEYGKAYYEIPVVELLPSSIADFDNIYITNVVYTNEWSTVGESGIDKFYYVDKCWLKRTYNNEEIGQVSVPYESTDTGYSQQEITDIYNMITNASTLEGTFDVEKNLSGGSSSPISFSSFQDAVVNTIECYHVTGTKTSDWSHIEIDYPPISVDSGNNMYWLNYNGNTSGSFNSRYSYYCSPYTYVRENNYSGYYDIVYFIVHEMVYDGTGSIAQYSDLSTSYTKYYYFISYRYYNKLILYREMDILEYLRLGNEGQEKIYDYLFYKINNIDDNAYHFFKDKLNIDNDIVDKIREIDNSITLSTDSIMDLLNRILDALLDIDIEPVDIDLTPIITRLDSILEKQTSSNLNNDWYKNYRDWLYSETPNNVEDTPHEYFINKLNDLKSIYDIFGNWLSTTYYTDMRTVIDKYLLGVREPFTENDNMTAYYYDGVTSTYYDVDTFNSFHIVENEE